MSNTLRPLRLSRGLSLQDLATRVGTSKAQIDKLERGDRRLTVDWLQRLAQALDCAATDITPQLSGAQRDIGGATKKDLPLLGGVRGGYDAWFFDNGRVMEYVQRPINLVGCADAFAAYAFGDSMEPRFYAGELLYVHPHRPLSRGCFVVVELKDGQGLVKQFLRQDGKTVTLHQFNPDKDIILKHSEIKHLYRIVGSAEQQ